jgi:uracil-DNA glycosylase family 4
MIDFNPTHSTEINESELIKQCTSCKLCPLSKTRNNVVYGSGKTSSKILVIGEAPGEQEDLAGQPFIGRSGQLLSTLFDLAHINRDSETFITNIVKCRPPQNRNPLQDEIMSCSHFLNQQIQLIQPKIILVLGSHALKTVLGKTFSITKSRGMWFEKTVNYMPTKVNIMPLFHPSYLLRFPSEKRHSPKWHTIQDLKKVKKLTIELSKI